MEPCLFRHGKGYRGRSYRVHLLASMEPCLFRHGKKYIDLRNKKARIVASMEPCLFRHGKLKNPLIKRAVAVQLQWSHVFSDMVRELWWTGER